MSQTKLSPDYIDSLMQEGIVLEERMMGQCTHVLNFRLPNGFEILASAACVDPANYDAEIGRKICLERVRTKVWEVEGYLLQQRLHEQGIL